MLKFFNRLEKTRNFVLLVFAILMVASLVFFYAPTQNTPAADLARSEETAASVSGEEITVGEIYRRKEMYSRISQGRPYPAKLLLDGMITGRISRVEAERLGLTATDAEVAAKIRELNKSEDGKPFDQKAYEQNVIQGYGSIAAYEQGVRDDISSEKLQAFITSGVMASEEEVLRDYQRKNTKFDLSYVAVTPADVAATITPTEAELREYFERNKQSYYINEPQKKIRYVYVNTEKIGQKIPLSDADLQAEYNNLPPDRKIAGVLGQEIVLRVSKPEFDSQVLEKANKLVTQLRESGDIVSEEAFANTAKGQSENAVSARNGGRLVGPVRENPNKADDPYQRLLKMKPGEITEPINYQGRYFILRRGEEVPKTFEMARKELEVSLRNRRAYAVAAELAQKVSETLKQNKNVEATAKQFASEANMSPSEMVRETGYVKKNDNVEHIGASPQFEAGIEPLVNAQDVGDKIPVTGGFAIPMLIDRKEPRDSEFEEVRAQLVEVVKVEMAGKRIEEIANAIASGSTSASAIAAAATGRNMKAKDQTSFILGSPLGEGPSATTSKELEDAIYAMKAGEATKTPLKIGDAYYIVGVTKREEANMDDFAKQRDKLMEQMLTRKRGEVYSDYLASTRQRYEQNGDIKIYKDAMAKLDEPALPFGTQTLPQFPPQ